MRKVDPAEPTPTALVTLVWMLAAALLGPVLARPFAAILGLHVALRAGTGTAWRGPTDGATLRRVSLVVTPVMLAVAFGGTMLVAKTSMQQSAVEDEALRGRRGTCC